MFEPAASVTFRLSDLVSQTLLASKVCQECLPCGKGRGAGMEDTDAWMEKPLVLRRL